MVTTEIRRDRLSDDISTLISGLKKRYGFDLDNYAPDALHRRVNLLRELYGYHDVPALSARLTCDENFYQQFLGDLFIKVTEMYRAPECFKSLRDGLLEQFRDKPYIKIWHAGCATGEEVYSMAILLKEMGLYERAHIYATDICFHALEKARKGIYVASEFRNYSVNYFQAAGINSLSEYYMCRYGYVRLAEDLRERIVFARHDLISESPVTDAHIIFCRNVLIYVKPEVRASILQSLTGALYDGGALVLGEREFLETGASSQFRPLNSSSNIYLKTGYQYGKQ